MATARGDAWQEATPFIRGFPYGLSGAMVGASMVFTVVSLRLRGGER